MEEVKAVSQCAGKMFPANPQLPRPRTEPSRGTQLLPRVSLNNISVLIFWQNILKKTPFPFARFIGRPDAGRGAR